MLGFIFCLFFLINFYDVNCGKLKMYTIFLISLILEKFFYFWIYELILKLFNLFYKRLIFSEICFFMFKILLKFVIFFGYFD